MARTKTTTAESTVEASVTEVESTVATTAEKTTQKRKYEATDLISCRSLTQGTLIMTGKKSGITYRWSAYNDICDVEYQDLYSLKASRSNYVYKPLFVIEDEELLSDARWSDLKAMYDKLYSNENMAAVLDLPLAQFKRALRNAPEGYRKALCIEAATRIEDGTFDSMNKVKAIDEICGTDLKSTFN